MNQARNLAASFATNRYAITAVAETNGTISPEGVVEVLHGGSVSFTITPDMLSLLGRDLKPIVEPGTVRIMIGASSQDIRVRGILAVTE